MLKEGVRHTSHTEVNATNTALTLGSGDMDVFATPAMVALMENAAMNAVAPFLPEGCTTVGAKMDTSHIKPSGIGQHITAEAELTKIDGRKLTFKVSASDGVCTIGEGTHVRYIVDHTKFLSKL